MKNLKKEVLSLVDKIVVHKRIAGNTLILYFDGHPGDDNVKSIWIDPSWRYERNKKFVVGSEDFPWEQEKGQSEKEYKRRFEKVCQKTNRLKGSKLVNIKIDENTNDLHLFFDNNQLIRNMFTARNVDGWVYRDGSRKIRITAFVDRLEKSVIKKTK